MSNFTAFTQPAKGRVRQILTSTIISPPNSFTGKFDVPDLNNDKVQEKLVKVNLGTTDIKGFKTKALWDTGATHSAIDTNTAKHLGLKPSGRTIVKYGSGDAETNIYIVDIYLPNLVRLVGVQVTECDPTGTHGVLIGMDVITIGDFTITNFKGNSVFSFRVPSMATVDYVKEFNSYKNQRDRYFKGGFKKKRR